MIKNIAVIIIALFFIVSCSGSSDNSQDQEEISVNFDSIDPRTHGGIISEHQIEIEKMNNEMKKMMKSDDEFYGILGYWIGDYDENKITIALTSIRGKTIEGYTIHLGHFKKIIGWVNSDDEISYNFGMSEPPEDSLNNGYFEFMIDLENMVLSGSWEPYKGGSSANVFALNKRKYNYDLTVGSYPELSQRVLDDSEIKNLSKEDLLEMQNEIFARHGCSFTDKKWNYFFDNMDWYTPINVDIRNKLTDVEVDNLKLIYKYKSSL